MNLKQAFLLFLVTTTLLYPKMYDSLIQDSGSSKIQTDIYSHEVFKLDRSLFPSKLIDSGFDIDRDDAQSPRRNNQNRVVKPPSYENEEQRSLKFNAITPITVLYNAGGYNITGALEKTFESAPPEPWDGETVYLTIYDSETDMLNRANPTDNLTQITGSSGEYEFVLGNPFFDLSDIGEHYWRVDFPGNFAKLRGPGEPIVYNGQDHTGGFHVKDKPTIIISSDRTSVGPSTLYTITATVTTDFGLSVDTATVRFTEAYSIETASNKTKDADEAITSGFSGYTKSYGESDADTITVTATVSNFGSLVDIDWTGDITESLTIDVIVVFDIDFTAYLDGVEYAGGSDEYRREQNLTFSGQLFDAGPNPNATLYLPLIENTPYTIRITGGGQSNTLAKSSTTGTNGSFTFELFINSTYFFNPQFDVITVTLLFTDNDRDGGSLKLADPDISLSFSLIEDLKQYTVNPGIDIDTGRRYYRNNATFSITGTISDFFNNNAQNVPVSLTIGDGAALNVTAFDTATTNAAGQFTLSGTISSFDTQSGIIIFYVLIGNLAPTIWDPGSSLAEFEIGDQMTYSDALTVSILKSDDGSTYEALATETLLNLDFEELINGTTAANFSISIRDDLGNIPDDIVITIQVSNPTGTVFSAVVVDGGNNGDFVVLYQTIADAITPSSYWSTETASFTFTIQVTGPGTSLSFTATQTYNTFGPDFTPPADPSLSSINGEATGGPTDIIVFITAPFDDNIRSVTLYWRASDNANAIYNVSDFTDSFTAVGLSYDPGTGFYIHTFVFTDKNIHGIWIQYFIGIRDNSGLGLLVNGDTSPGGYNRTGDGGFGYNFADFLPSWSNSTATDYLTARFGDLELVAPPNLADAVVINNIRINSGENITLLDGDNMTIDFYLPTDVLDTYTAVTIYYNITTRNADGEFLSVSATFSGTMSFIGLGTGAFTGNDQFRFIIQSGNFSWFTEIDYYFEYQDQTGNTDQTDRFANIFANESETISLTVIDDIEDPVTTENNGINDVEVNATEDQWTIEDDDLQNTTVNVEYTVSDPNGIGLMNVTAFIYTYNELNETIDVERINFIVAGLIVLAGDPELGQDVDIGPYIVRFSVNLTGLPVNFTKSWEVYVEDFARNEVILNAQGTSAESVKVVNNIFEDLDMDGIPDEIDTDIQIPTNTTTVMNGTTFEITQTIVTTDSDGNTITIETVFNVTIAGDQPDEEGTSRAFWIIIGFILNLGLLTLYYQRHNIREILAKRARARRVRGTLRELTDEIKRLGAEGEYKKAVMLTWEALERVSREIIQAPRVFNQTAREFAAYLSTVTIVDRETLLTLSSTYEMAKYGKDPPTHDDWDDAVTALDITVRTIIESGARVQIDEDDEDW